MFLRHGATERWTWCLFLLGPHFFHTKSELLQNLDCGLGSPGCGASGVHVLLPGCSSQPWAQAQSQVSGSKWGLMSYDMVISCRRGSAQSWAWHAESPSSGSKWGTGCLCEKHRINLFSKESFFLFLFSSWDLKNKTRGKRIQKSFCTLLLETLELVVNAKSEFSLKDPRVCCLLPFFHLLPWTDWWITEHCETREQTLGS